MFILGIKKRCEEPTVCKFDFSWVPRANLSGFGGENGGKGRLNERAK